MSMKTMERRDFLRLCAGGAGLALSGRAAFGQVPGNGNGPRLAALRGEASRIGGAGGNVVVLDTPGGLAVVDSGAPDRAHDVARLLADAYPESRVELLFNTHWHLEHTGGNEAIARPGVPIVAHENTRLWMSTKLYVDWQDRTYPPRPPEARPTKTFHTSDPQPIELELGGRRIVYGHLREAHTDGDIYVHVPELNVIAAGGAVTAGTYPVMDYITGGWIGGLIDATSKLIELSDADTLVVPQSGPPQTRPDLEAQRDMLETIRERMEAMALEGMSAEDMLAEGITSDFDARWQGDRERFISNAYDGLWWGNRLRGIVA